MILPACGLQEQWDARKAEIVAAAEAEPVVAEWLRKVAP